MLPGIYDCVSAKAAEQVGFQAIFKYLSYLSESIKPGSSLLNFMLAVFTSVNLLNNSSTS